VEKSAKIDQKTLKKSIILSGKENIFENVTGSG